MKPKKCKICWVRDINIKKWCRPCAIAAEQKRWPVEWEAFAEWASKRCRDAMKKADRGWAKAKANAGVEAWEQLKATPGADLGKLVKKALKKAKVKRGKSDG